MTTITNKYQIGQDANPDNNFTIQTPDVPDGSLEIRRGNADSPGDLVFTVASTGVVTFPQTPEQRIGIGQTWQDVTASRTRGVDYTNSTGRPIMLSIRLAGTGAVSNLVVNSVVIASSGSSGNERNTLVALIPTGAIYSLSVGGQSVEGWAELR